MPSVQKRTRGSRTPDERSSDAGLSAATLFSRLPADDYGDRVLKPLAVLLRFENLSPAKAEAQADLAIGAWFRADAWLRDLRIFVEASAGLPRR